MRENGKRVIGQTTAMASLMALLLIACGEGTVTVPNCTTDVLLYVNSDNPSVRSVEINARNIAYEDDTINKVLEEGRNIQQEPIILLIRPSSLISVDDPFLIRAWGYDATNVEIVAGAAILRFNPPPGCRVQREIVMRGAAGFVDADKDGFQPCAGAPDGTCDCNDQNPRINPFTEEACGDGADNNCNAQTDEGCT